jgi:hypothetical protein
LIAIEKRDKPCEKFWAPLSALTEKLFSPSSSCHNFNARFIYAFSSSKSDDSDDSDDSDGWEKTEEEEKEEVVFIVVVV